MQIGKAKYLKTSEDFGKTMNKDSRVLIRPYKGGIMFSCPKTSYMEANTQKNEETDNFALKIALKHPE